MNIAPESPEDIQRIVLLPCKAENWRMLTAFHYSTCSGKEMSARTQSAKKYHKGNTIYKEQIVHTQNSIFKVPDSIFHGYTFDSLWQII